MEFERSALGIWISRRDEMVLCVQAWNIPQLFLHISHTFDIIVDATRNKAHFLLLLMQQNCHWEFCLDEVDR